MGLNLNGSSQYASVDAAPLSAVPVGISFWFKATGSLNDEYAFYFGNSASSTAWISISLKGTTGFVEAWDRSKSETLKLTSTTTDWTNSAWHHCLLEVTESGGTETLSLWVDNNSYTPVGEAGSSGIAAFNRVALGMLRDSTPSAPMTGLVAELAMLSAVTTSQQRTDLQTLYPDAVSGLTLVGYWSCDTNDASPLNDQIGTNHLTATGATIVADHPTLYSGGGSFTQTAAGVLGPVGAVSKSTAKTFLGSISSTGSVLKTSAVSRSGSLAPSGIVSRSTGKSFAGNISFSGVVAKMVSRLASGSLSPVGALAAAKAAVAFISGMLGFSGGLSRATSKPLAGVLQQSGSVSKAASKFFSGSLTLSGAAAGVKIAVLAIAGALGLSGAVAKLTAKPLPGALSPTGGLVKRIFKPLSGALSASGVVATIRTIFAAVSGVLAPAGALLKKTVAVRAGSLPMVGAVSKAVHKSLAGVAGFAGALSKSILRVVSGSLDFAGSMAAVLAADIKKIALALAARTRTLTLAARSRSLSLRARTALLSLFERD